MKAKSSFSVIIIIFLTVFYLNSKKQFMKKPQPVVTTLPPLKSDQNGCPIGPIVSVVGAGRLGNQIWEYASAWSVARKLNRHAFVYDFISSELSEAFEPLSLKPMSSILKCNITMGPEVPMGQLLPLETLGERYRGRHMLLPAFTQLLQAALPDRELLRKELRFKPALLAEVNKTIEEIGGRGKVLIGIHVRRGDFDTFLPSAFNSQLTSETYFKNAMAWYRKRYGGPILFLIVSDDLRWCQNTLLGDKDVKIASKNANHDLALLTLCDHIIIDYGTYGFWASFLSKGHTVSLNVEGNVTSLMALKANWTLFDKQTLTEINITKPTT